MNDTMPNEKFTAARLPDICAPRHALINAFHQYGGKRVVVVSAPAGFGKTVSALLWLAVSGRKSIWLGLDEYDNMAAVFYINCFAQGFSPLARRTRRRLKFSKAPPFPVLRWSTPSAFWRSWSREIRRTRWFWMTCI